MNVQDWKHCYVCWGYGYRIRLSPAETVNAHAAKMLGIQGEGHVDCETCAEARHADAAEKAKPVR